MFRSYIRTLGVLSITLVSADAYSQETIVTRIDLPGASAEQEVTYYPSKSKYISTRDDIFQRLKAKDASAMVNPADGPWMRAETTATIGFSYRGVGVAQGRTNVRQITAAEEALYKFEKEGGN